MSRTDQSDLLLAHKYRISLQESPRQSNFRVVALVFLEKDSIISSKISPPLVGWIDDRPFLLGTNAEACWIANSICAERSALTQLRWFPAAKVNKIVIATDAPDAIAPGMLCREFMASCDQIPWDTPIVLGGVKCQQCKQDHSTTADADGDGDETCADNMHSNSHDFVASIVTLEDIYPHPSLYVRSKPADCVAFGRKWQDILLESNHKLLEIARTAFEHETDGMVDLHPITYVAAVLFRDKSHATAQCVKSLEYSCSLDAITQLAPMLQAKRERGIEATQIVQVDQFGIAHPPFAPGRAYLVEHGYGHVYVLMHDFDLQESCLIWKMVKASELAPMVPDFVKQTSGKEDSPTAEEDAVEAPSCLARLNNMTL